MAMRSLGYMPNEVELEVIIQRLDIDGASWLPSEWGGDRWQKWAGLNSLFCLLPGDGQVGFEEFVTLLGPKLSSAGMPDKFHGADFDSVFWKVQSAVVYYDRDGITETGGGVRLENWRIHLNRKSIF